MIYPYEKYLTVLLIKGYDNTTIRQRLVSVGMTPPSQEEIDEKRNTVFEILPKEVVQHIYPPGRANYVSLIEQHKTALSPLDIDDILPILLGQRVHAWEDVIYISANHKLRTALQALILYGATDEDIIKMLTQRYGMPLTPSCLHMYKKYMWNVQRMTKLEIYTYVVNVDSGTVRMQLMDALHKKEEVVKWRFSGENLLNLESILKEVMNEAFFKFRESMSNAEPDNVHRVTKWADLAIKAAEKFDKLAKHSNDNLLSKLVLDLSKKSHKDIPKNSDIDGEVV